MTEEYNERKAVTNDWNRSVITDWNRSVTEEFRATGGKPRGLLEGTYVLEGGYVLLLTTLGAKSGQRRTNPLRYLPYDDRFAIFATKGGSPSHPDWYYNLLAHPQATIEVGTETIEVSATVVTGELRDQLYAAQVKMYPEYAEYQAKAAPRQVPVLLLERQTL